MLYPVHPMASHRLFEQDAFRPEEIELLNQAYTLACKSLHDRGQPNIVRDIIAERIVAMAKAGERDPDKLGAAAINAIQRTAM